MCSTRRPVAITFVQVDSFEQPPESGERPHLQMPALSMLPAISLSQETWYGLRD